MANYRFVNDIEKYINNPVFGMDIDTINYEEFKLTILFTGPKKSLYEQENFILKYEFPTEYPFYAPYVKFIRNIPIHPNVLSNGDIVSNFLDTDWTPIIDLRNICVMINDMMLQCKEKKSPQNLIGHTNGLVRQLQKEAARELDEFIENI